MTEIIGVKKQHAPAGARRKGKDRWTDEKCGNCFFWRARIVGIAEDEKQMQCKFDSPRAMPVPTQDALGRQSLALTASRLNMPENEWCGDWEPKI